ncbi:MAG TPA: hypothetical protein VNB64_11610 [Solirubrobacteraceae bacterium]|nr:hypothetical protein [Solirubrobacteraceae bacterium]
MKVRLLATALLLGAAAVAPATSAAPSARQVQDGSVRTLQEVPVSAMPAQVLDAHNAGRPVLNGLITYSFNVDRRTVGGKFVVAGRRPDELGTAQGSETYGIVFLNKPVGQTGAKIVAVIDEHVSKPETGRVPAAARSAYVYATHGINRFFRYSAAR